MINPTTFYNNHYPSDFVSSLIPSSTPGDWRERGTVKVRHLAQAHNAMIQLGFRNHTYSPQVQCRGGDTEEQNGEKEKLQNERINKVGQWPVRDVGDWYSLDWQGSQWLFPQVAADSAIGSCAIRWNPNTRASACIWWWRCYRQQ